MNGLRGTTGYLIFQTNQFVEVRAPQDVKSWCSMCLLGANTRQYLLCFWWGGVVWVTTFLGTCWLTWCYHSAGDETESQSCLRTRVESIARGRNQRWDSTEPPYYKTGQDQQRSDGLRETVAVALKAQQRLRAESDREATAKASEAVRVKQNLKHQVDRQRGPKHSKTVAKR